MGCRGQKLAALNKDANIIIGILAHDRWMLDLVQQRQAWTDGYLFTVLNTTTHPSTASILTDM